MKFHSYVIMGRPPAGVRELVRLLKTAGAAKGLRIGVAEYGAVTKAQVKKLVAENDAVLGLCPSECEAEELRAMGLPWKLSVLVQPHWESSVIPPAEEKRRKAEGL